MINFKNKDIGLIWDSLDKNIVFSMKQLHETESDSRKEHLKLKITKLNEMKTKIREAEQNE